MTLVFSQSIDNNGRQYLETHSQLHWRYSDVRCASDILLCKISSRLIAKMIDLFLFSSRVVKNLVGSVSPLTCGNQRYLFDRMLQISNERKRNFIWRIIVWHRFLHGFACAVDIGCSCSVLVSISCGDFFQTNKVCRHGLFIVPIINRDFAMRVLVET